MLIALVGLLSCSTTNEKQSTAKKSPIIRKASKLISPKRNTTVKFGEPVDFEVETRDGSTIDSIRLESPTETVSFTETSFAWTPERPRAGNPSLRLIVYIGDKEESLYPKVKFIPVQEPKEYSYRVINTFPHEETAWTQGLFLVGDTLFEGTGSGYTGKGGTYESVLRKIDLRSGRILQEIQLDKDLFGEGIVLHDDKIFQLTWRARQGFVYDRDFNKLQTFQYPTEGWGITNYSDKLIMSDGSEKLYVIDPDSFGEVDRLEVYDTQGEIDQLNELEMINGILYANVWMEEFLVMIDPASGAVTGKIDLTGLLEKNVDKGPDYVLNGIAYDERTGHLIVTGKLHPLLFELEIIEKPSLN